jgi:hypothetical protein
MEDFNICSARCFHIQRVEYLFNRFIIKGFASESTSPLNEQAIDPEA